MENLQPYLHTYKSFESGFHHLYAWEGEKVVILSRKKDLNTCAMSKIIVALDNAYSFNLSCTGQHPKILYHVNKKLSVADVPHTCNGDGGGCGYQGFTGIELQNKTFDHLYDNVCQYSEFDQTVFYELGRNFWFYKPQYKDDPIATGYAIFMRFMSMDSALINGAPYNGRSFMTFRLDVEGLVDEFEANESLNWSNTLEQNLGIPGHPYLDHKDLFASLCLRLQRQCPNFVNGIWKESGSLPLAINSQNIIDNFFIASCRATRRNLLPTFQNWKCSISDIALKDASQYPF